MDRVAGEGPPVRVGSALTVVLMLALGVSTSCAGGDDDDAGAMGCTPSPDGETCNGMDDDCDGETDEAESGGPLRQACSTACGTGMEECSNGAWMFCSAPVPTTERCNGIDDDCNGQADEGCDCMHGETRPCGDSTGLCEPGIQRCSAGQWEEACTGQVLPADELCNGEDDDCDGDVDEGCTCMPGQMQTCGTDVGECSPGTQSCNATGAWSACAGAVEPRVESCNGLDDDCDGMVDRSVAAGYGWATDRWESNNECARAALLPEAREDGDWIRVPVADEMDAQTYPTVYPIGDEDWYTFRANSNVTHTCFPGTSQCAYVLTVQAAFVDGTVNPADYEMCVTTATCAEASTPGSTNVFCTVLADFVDSVSSYVLAIKWGGTCGFDDSRDVRVVLRSSHGAVMCGHYQLLARLRFDPMEACPP